MNHLLKTALDNQNATALNTSFGAILSIVISHPAQLADAFIVGFFGAFGAFVCSLLTEWLVKKIMKK